MKTSPDYSWRILVFIVGLLLGILVFTSEAGSDGVSFNFICKSRSVVRFSITAPAAVTHLTVRSDTFPILPPQYLIWPDGSRILRSEITRGTANLLVNSTSGSDSYDYTVAVPRNLPDCGEQHNPSPVPTGRECLAIPYPGEGYFVIDGNSYYYHNALSFVVPTEAIWEWRLYIDGQLILVFEQTAPGNCHITEDYRL